MKQCPYFKSPEEGDTKRPCCLHPCLDESGNQQLGCNGELFNCAIRLDQDSLNAYIRDEMRGKRADFIYNDRDLQGALQTESNSWLAFEMTRRFGQRQTRGIATVFSLNRLNLEFSRTTPPMPFGDWTIFPLSLA